MLNVTVDLFGRSVNVLEVDTRLEGFEHVLEYAFGPRGPFSATEVGGKLEKLSRMIRDVSGSGKIQPEKEFPNVIDNNFKLPKVKRLIGKSQIGDVEQREIYLSVDLL